ncbi:hypothetical protein GCM10011506_09250 [Marivirga lumbricoides]|uniref:Metal-dependent HD superfamily phosphohydrolase n=1 Tax=Marivirga lumbricoides TaxID=1046115 RepID=A0ABQ1LL97_9BACT|nr:hypothetical protein GCM10011506_09250 [Marivirga lumbricoides]
MENLQNIWGQLASSYTADKARINHLWNEIATSYSQKKRYYHNLNHLSYMCDKLSTYQEKINDRDTLLFSIFYHDIVYDATRQDNEEKSADLARLRLAELGFPNHQIEKSSQQIIATRSHQKSDESDTNFLLDFDLCILGDTPEKYQEYIRNIRKEYSIYPDFLYKRGRKKVLKHFLKMNQIFKTAEFVVTFEKQARVNLENELKSL